jgi:hypothetical protein
MRALLVAAVGETLAQFLFDEHAYCAPGSPQRVEIVKIIAGYLLPPKK